MKINLILGALILLASGQVGAALVTEEQSVVYSFDTSALGDIDLIRFGFDAQDSCQNSSGAEQCLLASGGSFDLLFGTSFAGDEIGQSSFTNPFTGGINNVEAPMTPEQTILGTVDTLFVALVYGDDIFEVDNFFVRYPVVVDGRLRTGERVYGQLAGVSVVPIPAAAWLFGTALIGLVGFSRRK